LRRPSSAVNMALSSVAKGEGFRLDKHISEGASVVHHARVYFPRRAKDIVYAVFLPYTMAPAEVSSLRF
jgi:hypothetical protein